MARTGRPPKPVERHVAEGTRSQVGRSRGVRSPKLVPTLVGGRVPLVPPKGLDRGEAAVFRELAAQVAAVTDAADSSWLELAAIHLYRAREARESIRRLGQTIEVEKVGRNGVTYWDVDVNPSIRIERDASSVFRQFAEQLGIGPSARARLGGAGVEGRSAMEELPGLGEAAKLRAIAGGRKA